MYLFKSFVKSKINPVERLFEVVSDYDIYCELIGDDIGIGTPINSPIRDGDDAPSFSLFIPTRFTYARPEEVWWSDFAFGSGNVFDFVKYYASFNDHIHLDSITEIIEYIDNLLGLNLMDDGEINYSKRYLDYEAEKQTKSILFVSREFTKYDLNWWIRYGIDIELLNEHDVRSLDCLLHDNYTVKYQYRETELGYVYVVYDKVKIYSPQSIKFKWRNTCPAHYLLGEQQLQGKSTLIITKSLKDVMTFKSFLDVDAVSPQSETNGLSSDKIEKYKKQYKNIYVVMDYDDAGRKAAKILEKEGFEVRWVDKKKITVNGKTKVRDKDISDYVKHHGYEAGFLKLKDMFPELPESVFRKDRVDYLINLKNILSLS